MKNLSVVVSAVLLAGAGFLAGREAAFGYAGEPGSGVGLYGSPQADLKVSTHHTHLTRALAYCAGFDALIDHVNPINPLVNPQSAPLAEQIAIYDELTDQGTLTGQDASGNPVTWNNFNKTASWVYTLPTNVQVGCAENTVMAYPVTTSPNPDLLPQESFFDPSQGWFTNRFGPWAAQFHFPAKDEVGDDLLMMRNFAYSADAAAVLSAREVYSFGAAGSNLWSATCPKEFRGNLPTGDVVKPGSVAAFATYLHSLGDSHSHGFCERNWNSQTPPWYYHSPVNEPTFVPGCAFNDHTLEFGCPENSRRAEFIAGTVKGGVAVFDELVKYAAHHGKQPRLSSADKYGGWLQRQLERYAMLYETNLSTDAGKCRVHYAFELMKACKSIAENPENACFADVTPSETQCPLTGRTTGCENGNEFYPMRSACSSAASQSKTAP